MLIIKKMSVFIAAVFVFSCGGGPEVANTPVTNTKDQSNRVADTVASHSVDKERAKDDEKRVEEANDGGPAKRKWSRSGTPIDTSKFDQSISEAEKSSSAKPEDAGLKKQLGTAYFERAVALTAARQYAAAIGDFRKAVSLDPSNAEAKQQIEVITSIYESLNIEVPKPGEEPAALEFGKEKN